MVKISLHARCSDGTKPDRRTNVSPFPRSKKREKIRRSRAKSTLARARSRLCLVGSDRVQHNLIGTLRGIGGVTFAPVVANCISEDISGAIESSGGNRAANGGIALQAVFGIFVPEVECTIGTGSAEGAVNGVEGDRVDRIDVANIAVCRRSFTVTLKGEV